MKWHFLLCLFVLFSCSKESDAPATSPPPELAPYTVIEGANGVKYHTGLLPMPEKLKNMGGSHVRFTDCGPLPKSFDLRTLGLVADVRDQGSCGSCWSFSKTGSLESALLAKGQKLDLAEQELVSCDKNQYGCGGGFLSDFDYQISHGQGLEKDFPYSATNGRCKSIPMAAKGASFQYIGTAERGPTEDELKCALFKYKTVPWITVGATNGWSNPPASEKTPYTSCGRSSVNHAVGVVGWWEDAKGKTQFIMKNSWGKNWGDKGYMSLPLGCNSFGEEVAFIEVAGDAPAPTPVPPGPEPTPVPPEPCSAPHAKLPAEVQVFAGTETMLGVKSEKGVTYAWSLDGAAVGSESMLYVSPVKDSVYKLVAKSACATAESQVRVRIVLSKTN